ncbi:hypothetical protein [Flavobacterium sp. AED]|uniref:hypothetical protein n=1 Tax=Flavobacterium sp. AED TaxID=1423323 RepID=UPI00057CB20A|nr:hypothetical protein [Flavobacterium sp. AED]KIA82474.1 hypothetical protein OA85_16560 [Flavobacterium sp. AED]
MSCILRIEGDNFKVHEFLKQTNLQPYIAYLKGDELGFTRSGINTYQINGCSFDLSKADFDRFDIQKKDALNFLEMHFEKLKLLPEYGLLIDEVPIIDFGIFTRMFDVTVQSDYLEPKLLKLAGELNFGIEISQYIQSENEEI